MVLTGGVKFPYLSQLAAVASFAVLIPWYPDLNLLIPLVPT